MRILHVIPSMSPTQGGPSMALPSMARSLMAEGCVVDVATTDDDGAGRRLEVVLHGLPVQMEGFRIYYFPKQTEFYKVSIPLLRWLWMHVKEYDVVHIHAVFSFSTTAAGWVAYRHGVPFIVRPLGVLNGWGMKNRRRWIKAWSFRLLDKPLLDRAAAIHYTSDQEREEAQHLDIRARPVVIPLGIDLGAYHELPGPDLFTRHFPETAGRPLILFLSRLDPKKNVELLLEAFQSVSAQAHLVVAGTGEPGYVAQLKKKSRELGLFDRMTWAGHVEGKVKLSALAAASVYVLPSHSENFGIALLEAMAAGLACVSTAGVALAAEAAKEGAVILMPQTPGQLSAILERLLSNTLERQTLGHAAATLARQKYSLEAMSEALHGLYHRIIKTRIQKKI